MINLLSKIKNAQAVKKDSVKISISKINLAVLEILKKAHYIESFSAKNTSRFTEVKLCYKNGVGAIHGVKILSKPSRNLYIGYKNLRPIKQGFGLLVLSTPK